MNLFKSKKGKKEYNDIEKAKITLGIDLHIPLTITILNEAFVEKIDTVSGNEFEGIQIDKAYDILVDYLQNFSYEINATDEATVSLDEILDDIQETEKRVVIENKSKKHKTKQREKNNYQILFVFFVIIIGVAFLDIKKYESSQNKPLKEDVEYSIYQNELRLGSHQKYIPEEDEIKELECIREKYIPLTTMYLLQNTFLLEQEDIHLYITQWSIYRHKDRWMSLISLEIIDDCVIDITGKWEGAFSLSHTSDNVYTALVEISDSPTAESDELKRGTVTVTSENGKTGKYFCKVQTKENMEIDICGTSWIEHPTFFMMNDFKTFYSFERKALVPQNASEEAFAFIKMD